MKKGKLFELPAETGRCLYLPAYLDQIGGYRAKATVMRLEQSWLRLYLTMHVLQPYNQVLKYEQIIPAKTVLPCS